MNFLNISPGTFSAWDIFRLGQDLTGDATDPQWRIVGVWWRAFPAVVKSPVQGARSMYV